jgi:hypothetical protein
MQYTLHSFIIKFASYQLVTVLRDCNLLNYLAIPVTGFSASTKAAKNKISIYLDNYKKMEIDLNRCQKVLVCEMTSG